ncbi:MAG TPA: hypothetical protein VJJ23_03795 [Candidatus Nanoarchaeia archaeon]|nr:hypothetical protein [Candidatus Nanoarchaeia archaeon]
MKIFLLLFLLILIPTTNAINIYVAPAKIQDTKGSIIIKNTNEYKVFLNMPKSKEYYFNLNKKYLDPNEEIKVNVKTKPLFISFKTINIPIIFNNDKESISAEISIERKPIIKSKYLRDKINKISSLFKK